MTTWSKVLFTLLLIQSAVPAQSRHGVVSGRIVNSRKAPVVGVRVTAQLAEAETRDGRFAMIGSFAVTDSNGEYRLEDIPAGTYLIAAGTPGAFVFYPGTTSEAAAAKVVVPEGREIQRVDFTAQPPGWISGRIVSTGGPDGPNPLPNQISVRGITTSASYISSVDSNGEFDIQSAKPGLYSAVLPSPADLPTASAFFEIPANAGVGDLEIMSVTGHAVMEENGSIPPFSIGVLRVFNPNHRGVSRQTLDQIGLMPAALRNSMFEQWGDADPESNVVEAGINARGDFRHFLSPGIYAMTVRVPSGYIVKSVTRGNTDLLKDPLNVTKSGSGDIQVVIGKQVQ
jgi:hypothetical protein